MTESETGRRIKPRDTNLAINNDEDRRKEEYDAVKAHVRQLLFGTSCVDCAMKRGKKQ